MAVRKILRTTTTSLQNNPVAGPNWNSLIVDSATDTMVFGTGASGTTTKTVADTTSAQVLSGKVSTGRTTVAVTAGTLALTNALHAGRTVLISALAGCAVTLPAATGSGDIYTIERSVAATSVGDSFAVANNTDYMRGMVHVVAKDDALLSQFGTLNTGTVATESDTATWNFTTTGICDIGDYIQFVDLASHVWGVSGFYTVNGAEATPFSAAV